MQGQMLLRAMQISEHLIQGWAQLISSGGVKIRSNQVLVEPQSFLYQ